MNKTDMRLPFGIPRDLAILAVGIFLWGLGEGLFIYFYPLALQYWGIDPLQIGAVLSVLGITMAVVQVPAGYLSDRFGPRLLIRAALILGIAAAIMMALAPTLSLFIVGLIVYSVTSFIAAPLNSYITQMRGSWSAQRGMTFISGSFQVGAIIGPTLGGWIAQMAGLPIVFRYSAGLFFIATVTVFFVSRPIIQQDALETGTPLLNPLANPRFIGLLGLIFCTIIGLSMPQQLSAMYLQNVHHLSLQQIGMTGTFAGIGAAMILFTLGNLRAPIGMIAGQLTLGVFCLFMWFGKIPAVFFSGYLFIGGYRLYHSMSTAYIRPLVNSSDIGLAYGLVETGNALAVILAPLAAGFLYDYNPASVYAVSLVMLAITISLTGLLLPGRRKALITS
jgi:MFS family permease